MSNTTLNRSAAVCVALVATACGGTQLANSEVAEVQSTMRAAEEVGAGEHPDAALHLKLAKEGIAEARALAEKDKSTQAHLMLDRAQADAELALQLARTEAQESNARKTIEKLEELRSSSLK